MKGEIVICFFSIGWALALMFSGGLSWVGVASLWAMVIIVVISRVHIFLLAKELKGD